MSERQRSVYEEDVSRQQHDDDTVRQSDESAAPLGPPLSEGVAEQQVETEPANQAAEHLQHQHDVCDINTDYKGQFVLNIKIQAAGWPCIVHALGNTGG